MICEVFKMVKSKAISRNNKIAVEDLSCMEEYEEAGSGDLPSGAVVASFSFHDDAEAENKVTAPAPLPVQPPALPAQFPDHLQAAITDNRTLRSEPNGITPPIDGEYFSLRRTFAFRPSTVRLLNELKTLDPDINVYLSTIVDKALWHYYKHCINKNE
jgi:hypothetical protein